MRPAVRFAAKPLAVAIALLGATPALALQFDLPGDFKATIDTTLSVLLKYETDINKARRAIGREDRGRMN